MLSVLFLGFVIGLQHALEADHVAAVSSLVCGKSGVKRIARHGAIWGLGHTMVLAVFGGGVIFLKMTIDDGFANGLEFGVGVMLVLLGAQVLWNLRRRRLHVHEHVESDGSHVHIHATHARGEGQDDGRPHGFFQFGRPFFRVKSFGIGIVHGLAGSAAVMLVLLPTLSSVWVGVGYLVLFGVGTILSMSAITLALGVPFAATGGSQRLNHAVAITAGVASAVIGVALMTDTMFGTSLLTI